MKNIIYPHSVLVCICMINIDYKEVTLVNSNDLLKQIRHGYSIYIVVQSSIVMVVLVVVVVAAVGGGGGGWWWWWVVVVVAVGGGGGGW